MPTFTALYDANVLYPSLLRDLLIRLATTNLFRARWTEQIHDEWTRNLLRNRPDLTREQLNRTRQLMNLAVPDCLVEGYEALIPTLTLPHEDDRHVLAAAIRGRADLIVTFNLQDFPSEVLQPYDLEAQHPDEFIRHVLDLNHSATLGVVRQLRLALRRPELSAEEMLDRLEHNGLAQSVAELRHYQALL